MSQGVPDEVKRALSASLTRTNEYAGRVYGLGTPDFVALGTGQAAPAARNRAPQAMATMQHVARILDVARYHLYLGADNHWTRNSG